VKTAETSDVTLHVDGRQLGAVRGQSLLGALLKNGLWTPNRNLVTGEPRVGFCGMGVCLECEVTLDGQHHVRACQTHVVDGMDVRTGPARYAKTSNHPHAS